MSLEISLNYLFFNKALLERALTRKAYALEQGQRGIVCDDQEPLRTLGDTIIKAILADLLMHAGCQTRAKITQKKEQLESQPKLGEVACELRISSYIKLSVGEKKINAQQNTGVLAETFEALIAAVYLDGGYEVTKCVVNRLFKQRIQTVLAA